MKPNIMKKPQYFMDDFLNVKSGELVDNFVDIDEALHSYLTNLNVRSLTMQQQQNGSFPNDGYGINPSQPSYIQHQQFGLDVDPNYYRESTNGASFGVKNQPVYEEPTPSISHVRKTANRNVRSKLEEKHSQIQEKNRMAQKRFRERQKAKINDLHQQINTLQQRVDQLMLENTSLQSHNGLLEKVLAMRDEHIRVLQQHQIGDLDASEIDAEARRAPLNLTAIKGKQIKLSTESLKKMTPEDLMQIWHLYVTEISSALVEYNSQTNGSTQRLEELIDEVGKVCMRLHVINPMPCKVWQAREYHTSELEELRKWQSALGQLNLSDDQKTELVKIRRILLDQLQGFVEEKKSLQTTLHSILVTQTVSHKLALEYLRTNQTVMRLREILRQENNAMLQFAFTIIKEVSYAINVVSTKFGFVDFKG